MSYIVFARKYRPRSFDDVAGQTHITTTLKNAIIKSRTAHAYLFAGPRGVGKTTTARILAKALNCEKGPTPKPCNSCATCAEIDQGNSLDILEIDGASTRGIDEIRNLRENVKFAPSRGRFKVYIIDEVHMLTPEAFNALLKTLEEPPAHVKFIFATTQANKIPPTILSRCQRFDFKRIATKDILLNLKGIIKDEKLDVKDEVLSMIARYSDGSLRDAQVILDQIISFTQGKVEASDVSKVLGMVDDEVLFGLSGAISAKDPVAALKITDRFIKDGKDVLQVVLGLIEHFRNISMTKIDKGLDSLIDAGPESIKYYKEESEKFTVEEILHIIYTLSNTIDFIRRSGHARIPFEAAIIKLTLSAPIVPLSEILKRLEKLQGSPAANSEGPLPATRNSLPDIKEPKSAISGPSPNVPPSGLETQRIHQQNKIPSNEKSVAAPAAQKESDNGIDDVLAAWGSILNCIKNKKISIASYLQEAYPLTIESKTIKIGFPEEFRFHRDAVDSPDNRKLVEDAIKEVVGLDLEVAIASMEGMVPPGNVANNINRDASPNDSSGLRGDEKKKIDPIIKSALDIFNGEIADRGL